MQNRWYTRSTFGHYASSPAQILLVCYCRADLAQILVTESRDWHASRSLSSLTTVDHGPVKFTLVPFARLH